MKVAWDPRWAHIIDGLLELAFVAMSRPDPPKTLREMLDAMDGWEATDPDLPPPKCLEYLMLTAREPKDLKDILRFMHEMGRAKAAVGTGA